MLHWSLGCKRGYSAGKDAGRRLPHRRVRSSRESREGGRGRSFSLGDRGEGEAGTGRERGEKFNEEGIECRGGGEKNDIGRDEGEAGENRGDVGKDGGMGNEDGLPVLEEERMRRRE